MSLPRDTVINTLLKQKTVDAYSTLNPATEVGNMHTVSAMGYNGSNSDRSYDREKRSYDDTSVGKIAMSTPPRHDWADKISLIDGKLLRA